MTAREDKSHCWHERHQVPQFERRAPSRTTTRTAATRGEPPVSGGIVALLAPTQRTEFWFPSSFLRDPVPPWLISFPWLGRRPCHTYANTPTSTSSSGLPNASTGIAAPCRVFQQRLADSITTRMTPTMKIIIRVESR